MTPIMITAVIKANVEKVFESYLSPEDNLRWNTAGYGWTTNYANINPVAGGEFHVGYKSPDEKNDFDLGGKYLEIIPNEVIKEVLNDDRNVVINFESQAENTLVTITFDAENENSLELQREGWSAVLENYKKFVERKTNPKNATITKKVQIKTTKERVWEVLLKDTNYKQWASAFCEGSCYQGEMKYDGKINFLSPNGIGICSKVVVFIPNYQVSFQHLGGVKNGIEDFESSEFEGWKGARETYTLSGDDENVDLQIYVEVTKAESEEMSKMWDNALVKIKNLCEVGLN